MCTSISVVSTPGNRRCTLALYSPSGTRLPCNWSERQRPPITQVRYYPWCVQLRFSCQRVGRLCRDGDDAQCRQYYLTKSLITSQCAKSLFKRPSL